MKKTFNAVLASLHPILDWVRDSLEEVPFPPSTMHHIEIALEEGLVNIFSYSQQGDQGTVDITIHCQPKEFIEIVLEDRGIPFNPLEHKKEIDLDAPLESREQGGLGIPFLRKLMDEVVYQRIGATNILTLRKNL